MFKVSLYVVLLSLFLGACKSESGADSATTLPVNPVVKGHYLVGTVKVPLGDGSSGEISIRVPRHSKVDDNWTDVELVTDDGRRPGEVFTDSQQKLRDLFQLYIDANLHTDVIKKLHLSLSKNPEQGGFLVEAKSACFYSGGWGLMTCGPNGGLDTLAHENMHGWQWHTVLEPKDLAAGILIMDIFTKWANFFYQQSKVDASVFQGQLQGRSWKLDYLNYGLQNDAEWLAMVFPGWLMEHRDQPKHHWMAIKKSSPVFKAFFDCLWLNGKPLRTCQQENLGQNQVKHQQYWPTQGVPQVAGFSLADSEAIWKVCQASYEGRHLDENNQADVATMSKFDEVVRRSAPDLPGSPARHYRMLFGDCNHDATTDWICTYDGLGPTGVGNGKYLWNKENQTGAFTFIVTGKVGGSYAEYLPDPYSTLPSMNRGSLAQPMYREWQGSYGSCNGANYFHHRSKEWRDTYNQSLFNP